MKYTLALRLGLSLTLGLTFSQLSAAQQGSDALEPIKNKPVPSTSSKMKLTANMNKVQLEATIRGSQEQPKVLTIVPWQLPKFTRIEGQAPILVAPVQLSPLFRESFVAEQQVYEKLFKSNITP
jgi:hypothetical protein